MGSLGLKPSAAGGGGSEESSGPLFGLGPGFCGILELGLEGYKLTGKIKKTVSVLASLRGLVALLANFEPHFPRP